MRETNRGILTLTLSPSVFAVLRRDKGEREPAFAEATARQARLRQRYGGQARLRQRYGGQAGRGRFASIECLKECGRSMVPVEYKSNKIYTSRIKIRIKIKGR